MKRKWPIVGQLRKNCGAAEEAEEAAEDELLLNEPILDDVKSGCLQFAGLVNVGNHKLG